jgi:hypothetical protein
MRSRHPHSSTRNPRPRSAARSLDPDVLDDVAFTRAELLAARQSDPWIVLSH